MSGIQLLRSHNVSLGERISLITSVQYRYEGVVTAMNLNDATITLKDVKYWGAENRETEKGDLNQVGTVFDLITFWISSIVSVQKIHNDSGIADSAVVSAQGKSKPLPQPQPPQKYNSKTNFVPRRGNNQRNGRFFQQRRRQNRLQNNWKPQAPKIKLDSEPYDIETANAELEEALSKLSLEKLSTEEAKPLEDETSQELLPSGDSLNVSNSAAVSTTNGQDFAVANASTSSSDEVHTTHQEEAAKQPGVEKAKEKQEEEKKPVYQPSKSFFDSINCSISAGDQSSLFFAEKNSNRRKSGYFGQFKRDKILNIETFGTMAAKPNRRRGGGLLSANV